MAYARQKPTSTNRFYFVKDLSEIGAFLITGTSPPIGAKLDLSFSIRLVKESVDVVASVIRHDDRGFAVKFQKFYNDSLVVLRKYLKGSEKDRLLSKFRQQEDM